MPSSPLKPGDRFGRYELTELLGKGGMGEVYRAQDTVLHRHVALKVLRPAIEGTAPESNPSQGAARILREARAAAGLTHPNAIAIYDVGEVEGVPFLAMEFVSGKTLRAFVGDATVTLARRIRWLLDVASALAAAHELGLVHRDVKPENVMVRDDGVVKVLDFGIARRAATEATKADASAATEAAIGTLTGSGVVVGTPFYMAPEQMRGEPLDGRADQFAWGVVAYELLTGTLPWDREGTGLQLVSQILSKEIEPPRTKNAEISAVVDAVVRRALAKSAQWRFASMDEIVVELEPDAAAAGITGASSRRRPRVISLSDAAQLAATQAMPPSVPQPVQSPSTRTQLAVPDAAKTGGRRGWWTLAAVVAGVACAGVLYRALSLRHAATPSLPPDAAPVESPMSTNPEAVAAYATAVQAIRDAAIDVANRELKHAVSLDPGFAAAYLRTALIPGSLNARVREAYGKANGLRAKLSAHDRELLGAFEPLMGATPDPAAAEARLEQAIVRFPGDAELLFYLGKARWYHGDWEKAAQAFDEATQRDPDLVIAIRYKAYSLANAGRSEEAIALYQRCLDRSPDATSCAWDLSQLLGAEGQCDAEERLVRDQIARHESASFMYPELAQVLYAQGNPEPAVLAVLKTAWQRAGEDEKGPTASRNRASIEILRGDFSAAAKDARSWMRSLSDEDDESTHVQAFALGMKIALESGRTSEVQALANAYEARRAAWPLSPYASDGAVTIDGLVYRAGLMDLPTFAARRARWFARNSRPVGLLEKSRPADQWFVAYAEPCVTADDAAEAIARLPGSPPPAFLEAASEEPVGKVYGLASRPDDALAVLGRAAHACTILDWPFETTWAAYERGLLLERRGDTSDACREYAVVLSRWGHAVPASRTAVLAGRHARTLVCAP